jgi:hypothetical protein
MSKKIYILETTLIPDEFNSSESVILLDEGFEDRGDENPISINEINFMTTLAVLSNKPEDVIASFSDWWREKCDGELNFQLLSSEDSHLQEFRAKELERLEEDGWSIKANFVAYCENSVKARDAAIEIIRESELIVH